MLSAIREGDDAADPLRPPRVAFVVSGGVYLAGISPGLLAERSRVT